MVERRLADPRTSPRPIHQRDAVCARLAFAIQMLEPRSCRRRTLHSLSGVG